MEHQRVRVRGHILLETIRALSMAAHVFALLAGTALP